jgi:hypothetical protein
MTMEMTPAVISGKYSIPASLPWREQAPARRAHCLEARVFGKIREVIIPESGQIGVLQQPLLENFNRAQVDARASL